MYKVKFTELTENEYEQFLNNHPLKSFMQTIEFAKIRIKEGFKYYIVGMKQENKILCATVLFSRKGKLPGYFFNSPRGYLIDYYDVNLIKKIKIEIKKFIKSKGGYILNIEPKLLYKQRDINGNIVVDGVNNEKVIAILESLGYKHNGFCTESDPNKQVRWAFVLDLENKTEEKIFSEFDSKTRNQLKRIEKYGITTRELERSELNIFKEMVENSGMRKNFSSRSLEYYEDMYDIFKPKNYIKYIVAELNVTTYLEFLSNEISSTTEKIEKLSEKSINQKRELCSYKNSLNDKIKIAKQIYTAKGEKVTLAGGMFMTYGDELVYLFSGSNGEYLFLGGQYLIQWDMIKYALASKYKKYNFYGISGNFSKDNQKRGLYEFKKGFNGEVVEYIGDFDLVISKPLNFIKNIVRKI